LKESAIVLAADRLSTGGIADEDLICEKPDSKIHVLSETAAVACAGVAQFARSVIAAAKQTLPESQADGKSIAAAFHRARLTYRDERLDLFPHTPATNIADMSTEQQDRRSRELEQALQARGLDLAFLIGSIDQGAPSLWTVNEHGAIPQHDDKGYVAIGGITSRASTALCQRPRLKDADLPTVIYAVYEAKKITSDCTRGVGAQTDLVILRRGAKAISFTTKDLCPLDQAYAIMRPTRLTIEAYNLIRLMLATKAGS
jgi:20S proteasome alpha/beta subunit